MPVARTGSGLGPQLASALCWTDRLRQWRPAEGALFVLVGKPFVQRNRDWLRYLAYTRT